MGFGKRDMAQQLSQHPLKWTGSLFSGHSLSSFSLGSQTVFLFNEPPEQEKKNSEPCERKP